MKILLDECITRRFKSHLEEHDVHTISELNLSGINNPRLLEFCAENNYDVLLTFDKQLLFQHLKVRHNLTVAVLNCFTSKLEELVTFLPVLKTQLKTFKKYNTYLIIAD
jgi:predicted nuclease of predicted toxin-antitoxin system